jgi:hypothetical protein
MSVSLWWSKLTLIETDTFVLMLHKLTMFYESVKFTELNHRRSIIWSFFDQKSLKIPKGHSEAVKPGTHNTMAKRKKDKGQTKLKIHQHWRTPLNPFIFKFCHPNVLILNIEINIIYLTNSNIVPPSDILFLACFVTLSSNWVFLN